MLKTKIVSSLVKVYTDSSFDELKPFEKISMLKGERISFQLALQYVKEATDGKFTERKLYTPRILGALSQYVTLREVRNVGVELPTLPDLADGDYERFTPGLYPDVLSPLGNGGRVIARVLFPSTVWIDVDVPNDAEAIGESTITVELLNDNGEIEGTESITVDLIDAILPEQTLIMTQWFHCDCLANYYDVEMFSEKHWNIIENFARVAHRNGINMLLTPTFTPPLDTTVGGERLTTQLVKVTVENGKYSFNFDLLDRWVDMCDRIGIKYFEIAHLFTQWGAKHAPKIMATVDGEYKRIFGWETDAQADEYVSFLRQFLAEFLSHMKKSGNDKRCFFHISDEPVKDQIESYCAAKASIADLLEGYVTMDALSDYPFYEQGIVSTPISNTNSIANFVNKGIPNLWAYYCCGECSGANDVDEIYKTCDYITIHVPLTDETKDYIGKAQFEMMKPGVVIVNTSRGGLVDTESLINGIKVGIIGGACLDVYEEEGDLFYEDFSGDVVQDDKLVRLIAMPNVLVTSHQAFLTNEALDNIASTTVDNLKRFFSGEGNSETEVCYGCGRLESCRKERNAKCF